VIQDFRNLIMKRLILFLFFFIYLSAQAQEIPEFISLKPKYKNSQIFNYTGAIQTWTVPAGVTFIFADVKGAQGGSMGGYFGGNGGCVRVRIPVISGQILYITVGGQSTIDTPLFGYGGAGGQSTNYGVKARAGGGLSSISTAHPVTQSNAFVIAGGGGGCTGNGYAGNGGAAGGINGVGATSIYGGVNTRGGGASQSSGGVAGTPYDGNSTLPVAGIAINGGKGGTVAGGSAGWNGGGGGGAGFFGGGGGAGGGNAQGSGGGGSSWTHATCINLENITGYNSGHGRVVIYW
jgi:hypothetical protein